MGGWKWRESRTKSKKGSPAHTQIPPDQFLKQHANERISPDLEQSIRFLTDLLGDSDDFSVRRFHLFGERAAAMLHFSNMFEMSSVNQEILKPLMTSDHAIPSDAPERDNPKTWAEAILNDVLYYTKCILHEKLADIVEGLLRGGTAVLVDGLDAGIIIETTNVSRRSIEQPNTEQVIRGSREGFIEQLGTNLALLRYRLPTSDLKIKTMKIGRITKTRVAVCFLKGIANDALVQEVEHRLSLIDIDGVLDAGYIEQFIEDNHWSPFPQVQNTERTDKAVANLLEGRVVLFVDGSPFVLIVPTIFTQFYQTAEDYSERFLMVSFIRLARLLALAFSLITPSLYVAIIAFNPELIPTKFAVAVAGGRAGIPFPSIIEVLVMEASMEVLREATLRLPQQIGGALSIVGVLVIGQAAVSAGFVSPITVVVIALTTIGSFATPAYNAALALRLLRFPLVIMAGMFGLYGVMVGLILIAIHMLSLRSFGVPYLSPVVPGNFQGMKDTVVRFPLWSMFQRPQMQHPSNDDRLGGDVPKKMDQPPHNTLDPLKVGNTKGEEPHGAHTSNHGDSGGGDAH